MAKILRFEKLVLNIQNIKKSDVEKEAKDTLAEMVEVSLTQIPIKDFGVQYSAEMVIMTVEEYNELKETYKRKGVSSLN